MKRFTKVFSVLAVVLCMAFGLAACGVNGKYTNETTVMGTTVTTTIELKGGGKLKMTVKTGEDEKTENGTYKVDGEKITITSTVGGKETTLEGTIKDGVINIGGLEYKK